MNFPESVRIALDRLWSKGFEAYLVGGCVRDWVMGRVPSDYDITTPSTPDETKAVFEGFPVFLQGEKHGTVGVIIEGEKLEITTHRHDGDYTDHRRPESVTFSRALADDLSRRDFTVNAMAYSPHSGLVDLFGGAADVENGIIRCVGEASRRFDEDALRILRAIRFSSTLGFKIEENTQKAIFENAHLLKNISAERIRDELEKYVGGIRSAMVMNEFAPVFEQLFGRINKDSFLHHVSKIDSKKTRLAFFFCCTPFETISKLKLSNEDKRFYEGVYTLFHAMDFSTLYHVKKAVSILGLEAVTTALEVKQAVMAPYADNLLEKLYKAIEKADCMQKKDMKINGADLIALGIEQGTKMGQVLDSAFDLILKGELANDREKLLEYVKTKI